MRFAYTRLITEDVASLASFYEKLLGVTAQTFEKFVAFHLEGATLWIFSRKATEEFNGGTWVGGENKSVVLEFEVFDVDQERIRIAPFVTEFLQEPKTMPWGNRSMLFRDPDANAINFFKQAPKAV
jgi:predicted enzyme related to lactoylglutathione lyase